jgi:phosphatidylethanolamine/phosphatidyl-N-methylethanolamine N-methyltransferase
MDQLVQVPQRRAAQLERRGATPRALSSHESKLYSHFSGIYDAIFFVFDQQIKKAVDELALPPGTRVLEIGVGTGLSFSAYPEHCEVVAIDRSETMLEKARQKLERRGLRHLSLRKMDACQLALEDDSFDCVTAFHVVSVVPDPRRMMREIGRVCKPGGRILLINYFCPERKLFAGFSRLVDPLTRLLGWSSTLTLEKLLRGSSLEIETRRKTSAVGLHEMVIARNRK